MLVETRAVRQRRGEMLKMPPNIDELGNLMLLRQALDILEASEDVQRGLYPSDLDPAAEMRLLFRDAWERVRPVFAPSLPDVARIALDAIERAFDQDAIAAGRRDLAELPTLSIDGSRTREIDDALSVEPVEGQPDRFWIHIADPCTFIEPGGGGEEDPAGISGLVPRQGRIAGPGPEDPGRHGEQFLHDGVVGQDEGGEDLGKGSRAAPLVLGQEDHGLRFFRDQTVLVMDLEVQRALHALRQALQEQYTYRKLIVVLGIMADKDLRGMFLRLAPLAERIILTRPTYERAAEPESLRAVAGEFAERTELIRPVGEALERAMGLATSEDLVLVTGSLYFIGEVKEIQEEKNRANPVK